MVYGFFESLELDFTVNTQEVRRRAEGGVCAREDQSEDRQEAAGEEVVRPGSQREWICNDTPSMVFMGRRQ